MTKQFARVLIDKPEGYTPAGEMFVLPAALQWQDVEWVDPWQCDHQGTMCAACIESWSLDHEIELPVGIDEEGRAA